MKTIEPTEAQMILSGQTAGDLIAAGGTLQQTRTPYQTAVRVQVERDLSTVKRRVEYEASMLGERAYYSWGVGGKDRVEGPSIELAMVLHRNWGNAAVGMMPVQESPEAWIFTAAFIDLETGSTIERQFRQAKKYVVHGKHDEYRKDDMRFQIGQSKAQRNVIIRALPSWLVDSAMGIAKKNVIARIEKKIAAKGIEAVCADILDAFKRNGGITQDRIEAKIGVPIKRWDKNIVAILTADLQALVDRVEEPDDLYPKLEDIHEDKPRAEVQRQTLSKDQMRMGDSATHQGYDNAKKPDGATDSQPSTNTQKGKGTATATRRSSVPPKDNPAPEDTPPPVPPELLAASAALKQEMKGMDPDQMVLQITNIARKKLGASWEAILLTWLQEKGIHVNDLRECEEGLLMDIAETVASA